MNYIKHHKGVFAKMSKDKEITSIDISIYNALFLVWNYSNFCETLSISRSEIMELSKVGNANTYTKSLKRLHDKGYIIYIPSHNPLVGSKITICKFDNSSDKSSDITSGKTSGYSADNTSDTLYKRYNKLTKEQIDYILEHFNSLDESKIDLEIKKLKKVTTRKNKNLKEIEFKKKLLDLGVEEKHVNDWIQVRNDKNASFTESAIDGIIRECEKYNFPFPEAIKICAESSWQGFKYEWIKNKENGNTKTNAGSSASEGKSRFSKFTVDDFIIPTENY